MTTKFLDYNGLSYFWSKLKSYVATTSHSGLMSPTDKAKVDSINTNGTIAYYRKEESVYVTESANEDTIPIGVSGFTTADMLLVDINGLDLSEGEEYEISGTNIVLDTPIGTAGTPVHFVVLRAVTATVSDYDALKGDDGVVQDVLQNGVSVLGQDGVARIIAETDPVFTASPAHGISTQDIADWNDKQDELVSGTNIKTINGESLLGSGDLPVAPPVTSTDVPTADTISEFDADAHMNSTDMDAQAVSDFVDGLNVQGGGVVKVAMTPSVGSNYSGYGGCYYEHIGKLVHVHIGVQGLTANTAQTVLTMPSDLRPSSVMKYNGGGGSTTSVSYIFANTDGTIVVNSPQQYAIGEVWYFAS